MSCCVVAMCGMVEVLLFVVAFFSSMFFFRNSNQPLQKRYPLEKRKPLQKKVASEKEASF